MIRRIISIVFRLTSAIFLLAELVYVVTPTEVGQADEPTNYSPNLSYRKLNF
jgi:hypothetical protein